MCSVHITGRSMQPANISTVLENNCDLHGVGAEKSRRTEIRSRHVLIEWKCRSWSAGERFSASEYVVGFFLFDRSVFIVRTKTINTISLFHSLRGFNQIGRVFMETE